MRPRSFVAALTVPFIALLSLSSAGCSGSESAASGNRKVAVAPVESKAPQPRTAEEFLARAEEAMSGEKGWTFAVKGREGLVLQGQKSSARYTAAVRRTTGEPWALHSTGSSYSKGAGKPEEIFVADGTVYVKEGGSDAAWEHGLLSDPEFASKVEDPVAALDVFQGYAQDREPGGGISLIKSAGEVELQVRTSPAELSAVRERGVVKKAVRELSSTLEQLRAAGVTVAESRITVERAEESLVLDASTYRISSHVFRCTFLIPYDGQNIRYSQEVTERNQGTFAGAIVLPADAK